jgi:peptidoglycan hydrolase-like protein with peptidoglycan-binding domain
MELNSDVIEKNPKSLARIEPEKNSETLNSIESNTKNKFEASTPKFKDSPSVQDVLSGKIDPITKSKYVIKRGMKGKSVYYVQDLLGKLGFSDMLTNFNDKKNPTDSVFGENTETSVYIFQGDNNIKETGIVDQVTLNSLIQKIKNEKNEK